MSARETCPPLIAEFRTAREVGAAARELRERGFRRWDLYGPAPIDELIELVPTRRGRRLTALMVAAAIAGALIGYFMQYWSALAYPINVGGRPYNGWPGFVPSAWEVCALFVVYAGFFGFFVACRLPRLADPLFAVPGFERASQDHFFICMEPVDARPVAEGLRALFERHGAVRVTEVRE